MDEEFSSKGLSIVALTSEGESKTEEWVESKGAKYAYAYDRGGKLSRSLGVTGIPDAVLLDASGTIIWQGFPSSVPKDLIVQALEGAISTPVYEWGNSAKNVKKAFLKGDLAKAIKAADQLATKEELGTEIAKMLRGIVVTQVAKVESDLEKGEVYKAFEGAKALMKNIKGLPEEDTLKAMSKSITDDKVLKKVLSTQGKLVEILATERTKQKECDKCLKKLESLLKSNEDEYTADKISAAIKDIKTERRKLKR